MDLVPVFVQAGLGNIETVVCFCKRRLSYPLVHVKAVLEKVMPKVYKQFSSN